MAWESSSEVPEWRLHVHRGGEATGGSYVLYWMHAAVRSHDNHALELAIQRANESKLPLLVAFGLSADYPDANRRSLRFVIDGLAAVSSALERRSVGFRVEVGRAPDLAIDLARDAGEIITDRGYLRTDRQWVSEVVEATRIPIVEVETNLVVPVQIASDKREYAARTFRPKVHRHLDDHLVELTTTPLAIDSLDLTGGCDLGDPDALLERLNAEDVPDVRDRYSGGEYAARSALRRFVDEHLPIYDEHRNQPQTDVVSTMSMYLHFGHISPMTVARAAFDSDAPRNQVDSFIEELVVRRELAHNFVWYEPDYDSYDCLPDWAKKTLAEHADDPREHEYTADELEQAETHDDYWNAAMIELRDTGYMHNYMRMYWGKKVLEWSPDPRTAYERLIGLNNKYFLDGRDPNSYTGVLWIFGLHDRAWQERPVIGKTRTMTAGGLERKADPGAYVDKVAARTGWSP